MINADGVDDFTMCGGGTIDGNGLRSWKAFWLRRKWNPDCTNKDEQRPRLVYLSHCSNVLVAGLNLQNAHFWTNHLYQCDHVKYLNSRIYSPASPIKAPSTDAIDIDVCHDVLVKNCYLEVNDDSIVLKGGKGPWADTAQHYEYILMEDIQGSITNFININPWTQFYDVQSKPDRYALSDFTFENLQIHAARAGYDYENTEYLHKKDVEVVLTDTRKRA